MHTGEMAGAAETETAARFDGKRFAAWNIIERKAGDKAIWSRVGIGYVNKDGSINVFLDSIPLQGKIQLRDDKEGREQTTQPWARRPRPQPSQSDGE